VPVIFLQKIWYNIPMANKDSVLNFYFRARWQSVFTTQYLIVSVYLCFFYIGNIFNAVKFAFFTLVYSGDMLGLTFALWGVLFEISVVIPFLASFYAIFLLPRIWQSEYRIIQKSLMTLLVMAIVPMLIVITDTLARYALETDVLREFVNIHKIL